MPRQTYSSGAPPTPDFDCCRNNKIPAFIPWRYKALTSTLRLEVPSHLHNILYRQGLIRPWRAVYNGLVLPPHSDRVPYLSFLAGSAGSGAMQLSIADIVRVTQAWG